MKMASGSPCAAAAFAVLAAFAAFTPLAASLPVLSHNSEQLHGVRAPGSPTSFLATRTKTHTRTGRGLDTDDAQAQAVIQAAELEAKGSAQAVIHAAETEVKGEEATKKARLYKHAESSSRHHSKARGDNATAEEGQEEDDDAEESSSKDGEKDETSEKDEAPEKEKDEDSEGEKDEGDEDDAEEKAEKAPVAAMTPPQAPPPPPVSVAPPNATEEDDDDDDEPAVGYQAPVVAVVTIQNLDYDKLAADQSLHALVEAAVREAIASEAGDDIFSDDVALVSWPGSVRARAVIKPTDGVSSEAVVSELKNSTSLRTLIVDTVSKIQGIQAAAEGIITCDVDVLVASKSSSKSKVMSKPKGHEHLDRVYELEMKAAEARQNINDIAAEEIKIDRQIADIENEAAFTRMVDERVAKVKAELEAPVFAETIGDMWKEMRMFGGPCLLTHLQKEKGEIKVRIAIAENNATFYEKQLEDARNDVKDAWYPKPKEEVKSVATFSCGPRAVLVALAVALLVAADTKTFD